MKLGLLCTGFSALLTWAAMPTPAQAFADPLLFGLDTLMGGGGGRYFTGSPVDGYSCSVCHRGGPSPEVTVRGLPIDGFLPGSTYDVELQWTNPQISHALTLEFVTQAGLGAGKVELLDESLVDASGRCESSATGLVAAYMAEAGTRRIIGVSDCGASKLRFRFTAPIEADVLFAATVVRSDGSGTSEGDGVLSLTQALRRSDAPGTTTTGGCSLSAAPSSEARGLAWLWLALPLWFRRRRS